MKDNIVVACTFSASASDWRCPFCCVAILSTCSGLVAVSADCGGCFFVIVWTSNSGDVLMTCGFFLLLAEALLPIGGIGASGERCCILVSSSSVIFVEKDTLFCSMYEGVVAQYPTVLLRQVNCRKRKWPATRSVHSGSNGYPRVQSGLVLPMQVHLCVVNKQTELCLQCITVH